MQGNFFEGLLITICDLSVGVRCLFSMFIDLLLEKGYQIRLFIPHVLCFTILKLNIILVIDSRLV